MFKRRKLNSIRYGAEAIALIGFLIIGLPLVFYFIFRLLGLFGIEVRVLLAAIPISIAAGVGSLVLFVLLLAIEFMQDRSLDRQYHQQRNVKIKVSGERYECPYCGSQNVGATDRRCPTCGKELAGS